MIFVPIPRWTGIAASRNRRWFVWSKWMWEMNAAENRGASCGRPADSSQSAA